MKLTPWFACKHSMPKRSGWYMVTDIFKRWESTRFHYFDANTPDLFWFEEGVSHLPPKFNCFNPKHRGYYWRGVAR